MQKQKNDCAVFDWVIGFVRLAEKIAITNLVHWEIPPLVESNQMVDTMWSFHGKPIFLRPLLFSIPFFDQDILATYEKKIWSFSI